MKNLFLAFCCLFAFALLAQSTPPTGPTGGQVVSSPPIPAGTVNSGTTPQVAYYAATGTAVSANSELQFPVGGKVVVGGTAGIGDAKFTVYESVSTSSGTSNHVRNTSIAGCSAASQVASSNNGATAVVLQSDGLGSCGGFPSPNVNFGVYGSTTGPIYFHRGGIQLLKLDTSESVFNDTGASYDFRVEGDTNANALFVKGSTNKVGIGTGGPATTLDVNGTTTSLLFFGSEATAFSFTADPSDGMSHDSLGIGAGVTLESDGNFIAAFGSTSRAKAITAANDVTGSGGISGALWLPPRTVSTTANTLTAGTCNASLAGARIYMDDTNDSKSAIECVCAANASEAYEWKIFNYATLTWGSDPACVP